MYLYIYQFFDMKIMKKDSLYQPGENKTFDPKPYVYFQNILCNTMFTVTEDSKHMNEQLMINYLKEFYIFS